MSDGPHTRRRCTGRKELSLHLSDRTFPSRVHGLRQTSPSERPREFVLLALQAFSGLFDRAAGMYADREEQMRLKRLQAEEEDKKRREEWEKEMAERKGKTCSRVLLCALLQMRF